MSEGSLCKWWEPILASVSEFQRKYYDGWIQDGQIQHARIQDGSHHQVKWEWMSLSQIELIWVRVLCKMAESKIEKFKMTDLKMAAIFRLIRLN